jgi:hypothetical protein
MPKRSFVVRAPSRANLWGPYPTQNRCSASAWRRPGLHTDHAQAGLNPGGPHLPVLGG